MKGLALIGYRVSDQSMELVYSAEDFGPVVVSEVQQLCRTLENAHCPNKFT